MSEEGREREGKRERDRGGNEERNKGNGMRLESISVFGVTDI